jgi:tetratricopeptide (TPR) repeat protein
MQAKDYSGAQTILEEISAVDPNFKDVNLLLEDIEERLLLDGLYAKSEAHFIDEDWESAASGYESLRALKPSYNQDVVEQRLYTSYVNAARAALSEDAGSLDALQIAEEYFRKALALSPQNPEVKAERELALLYLDAQSKFGEGRWGDVITELELVVAKDSDYAAGTARQTLYEAYVARGDSRMEGGEHDSALRDYQRAVVLAEQDPEAVLRLYEALLKAGNAQGAQSNYEAAVLHYSSGVDLIDLKARAREENPTQASLLETAEAYANAGNFSVAYERYRNALGIVPGIYCISFGLDNDNNKNLFVGQSMRKHIVEEGEYLTQLANQYQSTVCAIVLANKLSDPNVIYRGQELLIPVLP